MAELDSGLSLESLGLREPYDVMAEQSVLGAALLEASNVDVLLQHLREDMFYVRQNRAVYAEIQKLADSATPVDAVILVDRLKAHPAFEDGNAAQAYVAELAQTVPRISNISHYVGIVRDKYLKRQMMELAAQMLDQAGEDLDSQNMLESAEQRLYEIREGRDTSSLTTLRTALVQVMTHLEHLYGPDREKYLGVPTGFKALDRKLTGMGRSDLIILAARPAMGKTSFALNIASNVARMDIPVVIFSLEMSVFQLTGRLLSADAMVDSHVFRNGVQDSNDWIKITEYSEQLAQRQIYMDDHNMTVSEMKARLRQLNRTARAAGKPPVGLVVIDYLQLMSSGRRETNRVQEISEITRNLKIMAKDLDVPVLVLSQLSRNTEKGRADHIPMLSDLRDSGSIEQDADVVLFLYRQSYYDKGEGQEEESEIAQCIIGKNRHGDTGTVELLWEGQYTRFLDIDYSHSEY